jgi:hypothetical protein
MYNITELRPYEQKTNYISIISINQSIQFRK